jgi:hypothetical protein
MTIRKRALKIWPEVKVKEYLNQQYPGEQITWFTEGDSLYSCKAADGSEFIIMDDDDLRSEGIVEFLQTNGGTYVSN